MNTQEVIAHQRATGIHPADEDGGGRVSSTSKWTDEIWRLDLIEPSRSPGEGQMRWEPTVEPTITDGLKTLAWSLFVARGRIAPLRLSAARNLSYTLRYLAIWMQWRRIDSFARFSPAVVQTFRDDLVRYFASEDGPDGPEVDVLPQRVAEFLRPLEYLEEQARYLEARGFARMPNAPFGLGSAWTVALEITPEVEKFAPVIPDEVLLPVVREAHRWLDERAEDILRLQTVFTSQIGTSRKPKSVTSMVTRDLRHFTFTSASPGARPWHPPFRNFLHGDTRERTVTARDSLDDGTDELRTSHDPVAGAGAQPLLPFVEGDVDTTDVEMAGDPLRSALTHIEDPSETEALRRRMTYYGTERIRRLTSHLLAACAIVIRFQTGIRHGELFTFEAGLDDAGMPTCVEREQSLSGAYEMFFVKGVLSKGEDEPVAARWLLAGRLHDDPVLPDAVRALIILNRLGDPWRKFASRPEAKAALLVQPGSAGLAHRPDRVWPMQSTRLPKLMKNFIWDNVDLTGLDAEDERLTEYVRTGGTCLQSRQWRKTWANWMVRVDKRLLPAISQQFQHRSVLLTEEAYIGKDAMQLGLVESAAMERAVQFMRRAMTGEPHVGGGMKKVVATELEDLRQRIGGLSGVAQEHEIRSWLLARDVRVWSSPHGKCFVGLMPTDARCHEVAGTVDFANQAPSFANRTPKLCSGCPCFAVDEDDLPFWTERFVENRRIWDEAVEAGLEVNYAVANERWQTSAKVLQSLGIDVDALNEEVAHATHH